MMKTLDLPAGCTALRVTAAGRKGATRHEVWYGEPDTGTWLGDLVRWQPEGTWSWQPADGPDVDGTLAEAAAAITDAAAEAAAHPVTHTADCQLVPDMDGSLLDTCGGDQCDSGFDTGPAWDPYRVSCLFIRRGHPERDGKPLHRGVNPLPGPGPEPQYLAWTGGGYCAGDPLPHHLVADTPDAFGLCACAYGGRACWNGADGDDQFCSGCRNGRHDHAQEES